MRLPHDPGIRHLHNPLNMQTQKKTSLLEMQIEKSN